MQINSDFDRRAVAHTSGMEWIPSPMKGVARRMLDRIGDEVARATSIVRYDPKSAFSPHVHDGGEEFIVLDGVFQDEHGDYPAGTYVRNPIGTSHTPRSDEGCIIFVKLWQFEKTDQAQFSVDLNTVLSEEEIEVTLHQTEHELVKFHHLHSGLQLELGARGGAEYLILKGNVTLNGERFGPHDWLRIPEGEQGLLQAIDGSAHIWSKTGHLKHVKTPT